MLEHFFTAVPTDQIMAEKRRDVLGEQEPTEDVKKTTDEFVTWLPDQERLLVQLTLRVTQGEYQSSAGVSGRPPAGIKLPSPSQAKGIRYGTEFGVSQSAEFQYDLVGTLVDESEMQLHTFVNRLEPPK